MIVTDPFVRKRMDTINHQQLCEQNRRSWNAVVPVHNSHRYNQANFFRQGGSTLFPEERALLGNVVNKQIAHLMCNGGQDTLSLAQLGAMVTGVDISDAAIESAQHLAATTDLPATFVRSDVYDWLAQTARIEQRFEIVYCAYGAICWLSDLARWAKGVASALESGGRFVLMEFHPVSNMFDPQWQLASPYPSGGQILATDGVSDYVGDSQGGLTPSGFVDTEQIFRNPEPCYLFQWGLGEVVTALAKAGMRITELHEYPYTNGERPFARMREEGRRMFSPDNVPAIPLMYGLAAQKP